MNTACASFIFSIVENLQINFSDFLLPKVRTSFRQVRSHLVYRYTSFLSPCFAVLFSEILSISVWSLFKTLTSFVLVLLMMIRLLLLLILFMLCWWFVCVIVCVWCFSVSMGFWCWLVAYAEFGGLCMCSV